VQEWPARRAVTGSTTGGAPIRSLTLVQDAGGGRSSPEEGGTDVVGRGHGEMSTRVDEVTTRSHEHADALPEIRPWREVGWIFRDGDALAIERRGDSTRVRPNE